MHNHVAEILNCARGDLRSGFNCRFVFLAIDQISKFIFQFFTVFLLGFTFEHFSKVLLIGSGSHLPQT